MKDLFEKALEAFAVGDAMGMPTEFMTRKTIKEKFGLVGELLDPSVSYIHSNLKMGQVTDDTEQNLYLINEYYSDKCISIRGTVNGLIKWIEETSADKKGYIGPSSLKALREIEKGTDPLEAGKGGTTCGAPMRALAAALCTEGGDYKGLMTGIYNSTVPTHNTGIALEAAMSIGFAIHNAALIGSYEEIIKASLEGAKLGRTLSSNDYVGPSTEKKISYIIREIDNLSETGEVLDFIYYVMGTGMESSDVVPAAMGIFAWARDDVWLAIRMGASIGGDTDTIAAIAGVISALYARNHNIPAPVINRVKEINNLDLENYSKKISEMFYAK